MAMAPSHGKMDGATLGTGPKVGSMAWASIESQPRTGSTTASGKKEKVLSTSIWTCRIKLTVGCWRIRSTSKNKTANYSCPKGARSKSQATTGAASFNWRAGSTKSSKLREIKIRRSLAYSNRALNYRRSFDEIRIEHNDGFDKIHLVGLLLVRS